MSFKKPSIKMIAESLISEEGDGEVLGASGESQPEIGKMVMLQKVYEDEYERPYERILGVALSEAAVKLLIEKAKKLGEELADDLGSTLSPWVEEDGGLVSISSPDQDKYHILVLEYPVHR